MTDDPVLYGPAQPGSGHSRPSELRRPRVVVKINGHATACLSCTVTNRSHFTSDIYSVELEPWQQPDGFGLAFWSDVTSADVEILFGFLDEDNDSSDVPGDVKSMIIGLVDDIDIEPDTGKLTVSGRDLSCRLIDTRTTQRWPDQTASQIVTGIAEANGLTPNVTSTTTPAGQYYKTAQSVLGRDAPLWDIVVFLAEQEGFDAYVRGKTLYFGPPEADDNPNFWNVYVERDVNGRIWSNCTKLGMHRSLTLAGDIQVAVMSHNPTTGRSVLETAQRAGKHGPRNTASGYAAKQQAYTTRAANMTPEQALQAAHAQAIDITRHERVVSFDAEGDIDLNVQRMVQITGTNTSFDQDYYIDTVKWTFSIEEGFTMSVHAKNHTTVSETFV